MASFQKNKKRFNDDQIKSLEINFREDSRPESKAKQHLAGELGLQPRQVAVWFQNRRARSRTKQIEKEYNLLKASYDNLAPKVESLKSENQALNKELLQLQDMKTLIEERQRNVNSELVQSVNGKEMKNLTSHLLEDSEKAVENEVEVSDLAPSIDGSWTSSMDWCSFDSNCCVDESSDPKWWEFWS